MGVVIHEPLSCTDEMERRVDDDGHRKAQPDEIDVGADDEDVHDFEFKSDGKRLIGAHHRNDATENRHVGGIEFHRFH